MDGFILWCYVTNNFVSYSIIAYNHCKVIGHGNVYRDVIVDIRTYPDKVLLTQNYSYNISWILAHLMQNNLYVLQARKETLEFYKNVTS